MLQQRSEGRRKFWLLLDFIYGNFDFSIHAFADDNLFISVEEVLKQIKGRKRIVSYRKKTGIFLSNVLDAE